MTGTTPRDRLFVALDVPTVDDARKLVVRLGDTVDCYKVGLELVFGGGLEFALAGNLMFAAPDAQFGQPEMKLGVFAPAASVLLPLRIGQARAEDLLYSGRSIDAPTALAWGLANEIAEDPAAAAVAYFEKHLAPKSAAALAHAVRAAREPFADLARARLADVEALYLEKLMATRDAREGLEAFLEKRAPRWEHR